MVPRMQRNPGRLSEEGYKGKIPSLPKPPVGQLTDDLMPNSQLGLRDDRENSLQPALSPDTEKG